MDELLRSLPTSALAATTSLRPDATAMLTLGAESCARLRGFARSLPLPLQEVLLIGYAAVLFRLSGQETITISSIDRAGDSSAATFEFAEQASFRDAAVRMKRTPVDTEIGASFCFVKQEAQPVVNQALTQVVDDTELLLTASDHGDELTFSLSNASGVWQKTTLQSWLLYLNSLLNAAVGNESIPISRLALLEPVAVEGMYARLNNTAASYPRDKAVHQLFAERAAATPNSIAVVAGDYRLTYRELDQQSTSLATRLVAMGAGTDRAVGILLERSTALSIALLAVLKSGSCYVPLDPQHPQQRLAGILAECDPVAVITDTRIAHLIESSGCRTLHIDIPTPAASDFRNGLLNGSAIAEKASPAALSQAESLAYIIFTSGTTGKPKGVSITHASLTNLLIAMQTIPGLHASDRLLALATISFDMAVVDMFLPLVAGATLIIADRSATIDPFALAALIREHDITCMQATPTTWKMLLQSGWTGKRDLKVLCGGEALPRDLANDLLDNVGELWNCYGPTETTVWSSFLRLHERHGIVPVGTPIANTTFYVMDEAGTPVPAGVPGELYIGGDGVARGYFQRAELTEQRFVPGRNIMSWKPGRSSSSGARLFRTGDLVRLLEDENLEFFGRIDHQVKLRGFRIELGEIESVLRSHPAVASAAVLLRNDSGQEPRLVAYLIPEHANLDPKSERKLDLDNLREYCGRLLPVYMLPAEFVELTELPLTSSGKVDRKALPPPDAMRAMRERSAAIGAPPGNELESKLLAIFREVLGQRAIGATDSFFDYGGYSLMAVKLFTKINKTLNLTLPISLLFDAPTVRRLAEVVRNGMQPTVIVPIRPRGSGAPLFIIHSYLLYAALPQIVESTTPIYGIRESAGDRVLHSVEERAALYANEILKVCADGPFHLAGWCAAGSLTVEVARQLQSQGHRVDMVALLDGERPGFDERAGGLRFSLGSRLRTAWRFHLGRLRSVPLRKRPAYLADVLLRQLDSIFESFFARHRKRIVWLERRFRRVLPKAVFDNMWANSASVQDYRTRPYKGSITLFRASDVPQLPNPDQTLGWGDVALDGVDVVFVPGDHESMFLQPHLDNFGRSLREAMTGNRPKLVHQ